LALSEAEKNGGSSDRDETMVVTKSCGGRTEKITMKALKMIKSCLRLLGLMQMLMQDDDGGDAEEAVSVEWAEKCLTKHSFQVSLWQKKKGYQIFIFGNKCY